MTVGLALAFGLTGCKRPASEAEDSGKVAQQLASIVATCAAVNGQVEVMRAGQSFWEAIEPGATFRAGDWVRTGPLASARIEFLGGGRIELDERSVVLVEQPPETDAGPGASAMVSLESGSARGFLPATENPERPALVVRTRDGKRVELASAEKGKPAEFRLTRTSRGADLAVAQGRLTVASGKQRRALAEGTGLDLAQGLGAPAYTLLDFPPSLEPGVDARFSWTPELQIPLGWGNVEGASQYQVQVARDLGFERLVVSTTAKQGPYAFLPTEPGMFVWRVASRDAAGRLSEYGFARRVYVDADEARELLIAPRDGQEVSVAEPGGIVFAWQSAGSLRRYRLVVARDVGLHDAVHTQRSDTQQVKLTRLTPGEYYWGAYADTEPPVPLFQKPWRLVVLKTPPKRARLRAPSAVDQWGR